MLQDFTRAPVKVAVHYFAESTDTGLDKIPLNEYVLFQNVLYINLKKSNEDTMVQDAIAIGNIKPIELHQFLETYVESILPKFLQEWEYSQQAFKKRIEETITRDYITKIFRDNYRIPPLDMIDRPQLKLLVKEIIDEG